jgi:hypothetical protein
MGYRGARGLERAEQSKIPARPSDVDFTLVKQMAQELAK